MTLDEKQSALSIELAHFKNGQDRLAHLVARARRATPSDGALRRDEHLVEGCLSRLWFVPSVRKGRCHFQSDSDSAIVKGIAGLLCEFYSGHTPEEILEHDPTFLARSGITQHLTANRRNGLAQMTKLIREFAADQAHPAHDAD